MFVFAYRIDTDGGLCVCIKIEKHYMHRKPIIWTLDRYLFSCQRQLSVWTTEGLISVCLNSHIIDMSPRFKMFTCMWIATEMAWEDQSYARNID